MAKSKPQTSVANRHIYSRASFCYQAATYLAQATKPKEHDSESNFAGQKQHGTADTAALAKRATENMSRQMISDMRAISLKVQIRQSPDLKRTMCKICDSLLIEGQSCLSMVENHSKGGKKPWADVLVIQCLTCKNVKRIPIGAQKQKRKQARLKHGATTGQAQSAEGT